MSDFTLNNLSQAGSFDLNEDLLLLRSGSQDYKLPLSTLASDLLSDTSGAGKVGIVPIYGLDGDTVQEALQELYERETISPQPLAPSASPAFEGLSLTELADGGTESLRVNSAGVVFKGPVNPFNQGLNTGNTPEFNGLSLTSLGNYGNEMLVADSNGTLSTRPLPEENYSRCIYSQLEEVVVDSTVEQQLLPAPYVDSVGAMVIPEAHWQHGAFVEIDFLFEAAHDDAYSSLMTFDMHFGASHLTESGGFDIDLSDAGNGMGRGKVYLVYKSGTLASADMDSWMEITRGNDSASAVVASVQTAIKVFNEVPLTGTNELSMSVTLADSDSSITIRHVRVLWHPAPQALA